MVSNRTSLRAQTPGTLHGSAARGSLSAREVHERLRAALAELQQAERNAVLWFSEIVRRKLYRVLGYASIHQYAELSLGFKKSKTSQFLRLSECLKELPELRRSMAAGELSWTKAREVAKVATPGTETAWIREAKQASSRALEMKVKETRRRAREAGAAGRGQGELGVDSGVSGSEASDPGASDPRASGPGASGPDASPRGREGEFTRVNSEASAPSVPMDVHLRMTPEQYARYQALIERARKNGHREDRTELMLAALEQLALSGAGTAGPNGAEAAARAVAVGQRRSRKAMPTSSEARPEFTRVNSRSPYQVIVQQCPDCGSGRVATNRGDRKLAPQELRAILCDADRRMPGKRNRAAVPERQRRAVLERDGFRCRSAGCGGTSFLAVHHLVPRERGGGNTLENLLTLCSGCHRALHARE